ncbi:MAG: esterase family protein [Candidatus Heimdallarchaeota archaeon]|nr:MAG: esterase family protein [Candidatus Heimdallarchaeota archaeon]
MDKSLSIVLILCLIYSNINLITPIFNCRDFQIVATDNGFSSTNINFKGTDINSNITFSGFYDFLTQYNNSTELEKPTIIANYISWQETDGGGFPAIQNDSHVVFIYYNSTALIESCAIVGDFSAYNAINMTKLDPNYSFFYYSLSNNVLQFPHTSFNFMVEPTTRIDYFFIINGEDVWLTDPRNHRQSPYTFGQNASELAMPLFQQPLEIIHHPDIPHGTLTTLQTPWHNPNVQVYLPPGYDPYGSYPTMYTGDGSYYITLMSAIDILDNMIADQRITPLIAVFIDHKDADPNDPNNIFSRIDWYNCNPEYLTYLDSLVTYIDENYATIPSPYARLHLGLSISALASAYVILERPKTFKLLASQSGSYSKGEDSYEIMTKYTHAPGSLDLKTWFSVGTYENNNNFNTPMVDDTKNMVSICTAKGWHTETIYNPECHSFGAWRHILDDMLEYFFSEPITKLPTSSQMQTTVDTSVTQITTSTSIIQESTIFPFIFVLLPLIVLIYSRKRNKEREIS